ncbi:DEAD/DEAH box helicase family protein [Peribacillus frigoritolerans]|uniref:DEAD/DEAH box helicase family protein n=1 Tax=Peribacillus frigoritolerans TaxID=450367 RepID=UPI00105A0E5C|nr:DEAD/DEAH box helicase family protein [Peribacillus frigoritolerans]TDL80452.1 DNA helicase [Peribacillus frigoritolerans]
MSKVQLITNQLVERLIEKMETAETIYILTSFVMKSGVDLLEKSLLKAAERNADIKICTGDYLYITQPEAIEKLAAIHPSIEVRMWKSNGVSFHPKAYLFEDERNGTSIIGSSNLSRSALTKGYEWNIEVDEESDGDLFITAAQTFLEVFHHEQTIPINKVTAELYKSEYEIFHAKIPQLVKKGTALEEQDLMLPVSDEKADLVKDPPVIYGSIQPRFAQIEALEELNTVYESGYDSAMIVMATGLGKTYLAGFFAEEFPRILFIAHLEEILYQAKSSFEKIIQNRSLGIYNGKIKDSKASIVFASIQTLSRKKHLEVFDAHEFDLIIVDEFHHAAAASYQKVINYYKPAFLLGITATPDRNDNRDVYDLCKGNVAYKIDFLEAIEKNWLSAFKYVGVYDDTDYSRISWLGTRYDEEELLAAQLRHGMADKIIEAWENHKQSRTIVFCSSIRQADFLSQAFSDRGYRTVSLHSQYKGHNRNFFIEQLDRGQLDAIFTVNLFNEGVDIPSVDTLLFVRPTESLTVFTQQIGRGLRLHPDKEKCVIIDLIGNYRNADLKLSLLRVPAALDKSKSGVLPTLPANCVLDLEMKVIDLLNEMMRKKQPRKEMLLANYNMVKEELGKRPSYLELHLKGAEPASAYRSEFKSYPAFLNWADELHENEKRVFETYKDWFTEVEKTGMTKSYKMIVLLYMLNKGPEKWMKPITPEEAAPFFFNYLTEKEYRRNIDFSGKAAMEMWNGDLNKVAKLIRDMPMTKWSGSSNGLVIFNEGEFSFNLSVNENDELQLFRWTKEICEYRLHEYFERKDSKVLK